MNSSFEINFNLNKDNNQSNNEDEDSNYNGTNEKLSNKFDQQIRPSTCASNYETRTQSQRKDRTSKIKRNQNYRLHTSTNFFQT